MGVNLIIYPSLKLILVSLAFIAGIFVIGTKNAIISVFNLIVLYILVAFYLIYMGITYLGISYIIVYIGAIAILFLFVIMMIDVEIIEKKSNNYLPLLFLLLGGFIISLKKILYNIGVIKIKSLSYEKQDTFLIDCANERLFNRISQSDIHEDKVISPLISSDSEKENVLISSDSEKENVAEFLKDLIWKINDNCQGFESWAEKEAQSGLENSNIIHGTGYWDDYGEDDDLVIEVVDNDSPFSFEDWESIKEFNETAILTFLDDIVNFKKLGNQEDIILAIDTLLKEEGHSEYIKYLLNKMKTIIIPEMEVYDINNEEDTENQEYDIKSKEENSNDDVSSVLDEDDNKFNLDVNELLENVNLMIEDNILKIEKVPVPDLSDLIGMSTYNDNNYLLIIPDWDSAINRITQISAIGDVLYSVYHSYIYIVSVILLLGMIGAIILTAESNIHRRIMNIRKPKLKSSNIFSGFFIFPEILNIIRFNYYFYKEEYNNKYKLYRDVKNSVILNKEYPIHITLSGYIPLFVLNNNNIHSEDIIGNLIYFIISNVFIGLLLLIINSFFSLSVKYLEKGGGFECGFTSFIQTRERFNIIFYRVSLLFLVFDLEIILIFPYPALYQKNQNISKNNVLAFLYILIVGFIYELKEGALNIVKKAHSTEINIRD